MVGHFGPTYGTQTHQAPLHVYVVTHFICSWIFLFQFGVWRPAVPHLTSFELIQALAEWPNRGIYSRLTVQSRSFLSRVRQRLVF